MSEIKVFEVGPRDGLQNERKPLKLAAKERFIRGLVHAGVRHLEVGAFVRPDKVPQMADTGELFARIASGKLKLGRAQTWSLVPNQKGLERAIEVGAKNIAVFTAATDGFNRNNIGMSVVESLKLYAPVIAEARRRGMRVRGYVSTAFGCPFDGKVEPAKALRVIEKLAALGAHEISIGDTIGVADPRGVSAVMGPALKLLGPKRVAGHFHDTRGTALANALRAIELGVRTLDSSAGGLGGCPFAPGASGNLATEDLVYMLDGMGMRTGIDLEKLCRTSVEVLRELDRRFYPSKLLQAWNGTRKVRPYGRKNQGTGTSSSQRTLGSH
jgi:hydroxymethylglutaryl-CoA lyase